MNTYHFWINHFTPPADNRLKAFLSLTASDCHDILSTLGIPPCTRGIQHESPENRVFEFGDVVLKFYRPGRWNLAALQDELQFLTDLHDAEIPFVRALGEVGNWRGVYYVVFQTIERPYRTIQNVLSEDDVRLMVERVARIHDVGALREAIGRPRFEPDSLCSGCFEVIRAAGFLPSTLFKRYRAAFESVVAQLNAFGALPLQRIHGDSYSGNAIWRSDGPIFLDLDDFLMGPVAMDVMLLSFGWRLESLPESMDRKTRRTHQHELVLDIYREHRDFPKQWERLFPWLRACRAVEFDAWFSSRWLEPGFAEHYTDDDITDPQWWIESIESIERALE